MRPRMRLGRRPLPPLRKACWVTLPLADYLGDRGGDLRRTWHARFHTFQSVRHVDHSQGIMKHRGRKQDLNNQKPGGSLVSPSGGMNESCELEKVVDRESRSLLMNVLNWQERFAETWQKNQANSRPGRRGAGHRSIRSWHWHVISTVADQVDAQTQSTAFRRNSFSDCLLRSRNVDTQQRTRKNDPVHARCYDSSSRQQGNTIRL